MQYNCGKDEDMSKKLSMILGLLMAIVFVIGLTGPVGANAASKVKLSATKKTVYVGEQFGLELTGAKGTVKWSSSSKKVATVKDGLVTAVKTGKATIKAKDSKTNKTYKCNITVKKNSLSDKTLKIKAGESAGLTLKGNTPADWTSSDESVAIVNNGTVTALKKGTATITAKVGSKKYTCKVTVAANADVTDEPVELTLWTIESGEGLSDAYIRAIDDLKKAYPNVTLNPQTFEQNYYKEKIRNSATAGDLPDIFFTWSGAFLGEFADMGVVYCLDDIMARYMKSGDISQVMLDNTTYNDKHYGIPMGMSVVVLYVNMDLLNQVGIKSVPKTLDDLYDCCDKLVAAGITPFGCAGETWCISEYVEPIIEKTIGAKALDKIFSGKASFDNDGVVEAADVFTDMLNRGYFGNERALDNGEVSGRFMDGRIAFYMNGSWHCGNFAGDPEFASKVTVSEFPVINSKNSKIGELIGGPSDTLAVSALSKNTGIAAEYAVALGKLVSKYSYLEGSGLPTWKIGYDDSGVNALTRQVSKLCDSAKGFVLFGDTAMPVYEKKPYLDSLSKLFRGELGGKAFTKELAENIR